jgi:hypothetical protein
MWATLLPYILALVLMLLTSCLGSLVLAAAVKGG